MVRAFASGAVDSGLIPHQIQSWFRDKRGSLYFREEDIYASKYNTKTAEKSFSKLELIRS